MAAAAYHLEYCLINPSKESSCFWYWVYRSWYHRVFSTDTNRTEAVINPALLPVHIFERSFLISRGARLLRARSLPNIQVAPYTSFPQESPLWGWLYLVTSQVWDYLFEARLHIWRGLSCWLVAQHFPPSISVLCMGLGIYCSLSATLSRVILCVHTIPLTHGDI